MITRARWQRWRPKPRMGLRVGLLLALVTLPLYANSSKPLIKDIYPGSSGSDPRGLVNFNGLLFFIADDGTGHHTLWKSDGTSEGTQPVEGTVASGPLFIFQDVLFFFAGAELWKSHGTLRGLCD
jgi:ELWxxDGT repeat protein